MLRMLSAIDPNGGNSSYEWQPCEFQDYPDNRFPSGLREPNGCRRYHGFPTRLLGLLMTVASQAIVRIVDNNAC